FRLFGIIPKTVHVRLYCNGELVLDGDGPGRTAYLDSEIKTNHANINSIIYEFETSGVAPVTVSLHYLGMLSDKTRPESPFTEEWEGFFSDNPDYGIYMDYLISADELQNLRDKIKHEPYKTAYEKARETALEAMKKSPEKAIGRTVYKYHREPLSIEGAMELAIVGQVEQNKEMLRMACRCALSLASCEYWCADVMETIPMITWHHRAFTESEVAGKVCMVIWLAGGLLSWHGRNYLYNAIIMKALPRMEADFMTMDYIYHCNQGLAFMHGYMQSLITLSAVYPRYSRKIAEAVKLMEEMYTNVFGTDGTFEEGAMYLDFTMRHYLPSIYYLSRFKNQSISEVAGGKLRQISQYALSVLTESGTLLAFGDCGSKVRYKLLMPAMLYRATGDMRWASVFKKSGASKLTEAVIAAASDIPDCDTPFVEEFSYFPRTGVAKLLRGGIMLAVNSGPSNDTHCHCDKGSFLVYRDGEPVVPDFYASYQMADSVSMFKTGNHSLAIPVINGQYIEQHRGKEYMSVVEQAAYEKGVFEFVCDNSGMWDSPEVICSKRTIRSDKANEFVITDEFQFISEAEVEFRLNLKDEGQLEVTTVNWEPCSIETGTLCNNNG
ncbi:MAG: heparinase II/III family protein, partial [Clostridia bacterium]|nr:heparinase II/III family protein [Clostridia bacterium]